MHPLLPAYLRAARAEKHFADMNALINLFLDGVGQQALRGIELDQKTLLPNKPYEPFWPPEMAAIQAGETVQNLRSAMDYLVFELAKLDTGGVEQEGTQFPIDDSPSSFEQHSTPLTKKGKPNRLNMLPGLSSSHIDAIEELQPYKGTYWIRRLRDLSNLDKHRSLFHNVSAGNLRFRGYKGPRGYFDTRTGGRKFEAYGADGEDVYVTAEPTMELFVQDGMLLVPLVPILQELLIRIPETLEAFEPEFY
jgi:hypothetical protein